MANAFYHCRARIPTATCELGFAKPPALSLRAQEPSALTLPAALLLGFALIVQLLAARERKLDLGTTFLVEIELQRHQRHALALDRSSELVDLSAVQEQL